MKRTILKMMFVGILTTSFVTSCSTNLPSIIGDTSKSNSLTGKWEVDYIATNDGKTLAESYPQGVPYINFVSDKLVNAFDGCNTLNGGITIAGNEITFGNLIATMKACDGVNDRAFSSKLQGKVKYSLDNETLTIIQDDIAVMRLKRPGKIAGTWELEEFITKDRSAKTVNQRFPNKIPTVTFQGNQISGNDGCNNLSGGYLAIGNSLTMKNIATTRMACQEGESDLFLQYFNQVKTYEIQGDKLVLFADGVKTMVFKKK